MNLIRKEPFPSGKAQTVDKPRDASKGPQALRLESAGGDMRVAEERLKAASYINFWP